MSAPYVPPPSADFQSQGQPPRNGLGTAGFVLGLVGLLLSFIPLIGVVAWPLVILGLVLSIVGIVRPAAARPPIAVWPSPAPCCRSSAW
jgi:hypothetical protein